MKMKKRDPKYLGIPNINFSMYAKEDNREKEFKKQRLERGFDESEIRSLGITVAKFIIPRLKEYKRIASDEFGYNNDDKFYTDMDKVLKALELIARDYGHRMFTIEEEKEIYDGLDLLSKNLLSWWW